MENSTNDYHISFFKPTTPQAKRNRNMVVWLVSIWFLAIFGFQILLKVIEKPTPEASYVAFENVWDNVKSGTASETEIQEFGKSALSVLGKIDIKPDAKKALSNALAYSVNELTADSMQTALLAKVQKLETIKSEITDISDPAYIAVKKEISDELSPVLGLASNDVRTRLLPIELESKGLSALSSSTIENLPDVMSTYLIHNQSFLTDSKFLGFPFHYFYTAVFLLILFVGLCYGYCVRIDTMNAKLEIED